MKKQPYLVALEKGKNYAWCECAESQSQPFCDGSHANVNKRRENLLENLQEISFITNDYQKLFPKETKAPLVFTAEKDTEVSLCGCKQSNNAPFCSGEHVNI